MSVVFLWYSSSDIEAANRLAELLLRGGIQIEHKTLPVYEQDEQPTDEGGASENCLVLLWSQFAAQSTDADKMVQRAVHAWSRNRLVLIQLDGTALPKGLNDLPTSSLGAESDLRAVVNRVFELLGLSPGPSNPIGRKHRLGGLVLIGIATLVAITSWAYIQYQAQQPLAVETVLPSREPPSTGLDRDFITKLQPQFAFERSFSERFFWPIMTIVASIISIFLTTLFFIFGWASQEKQSNAKSRHRSSASRGGSLSAMAQETSHAVFVSYSHQDALAVDRLVQEIERAGYLVWMDRSAAHGAHRYAAPIVAAIKACKLVALMCSQNAFRSDHVVREVYVAGDYKKPFIAFQLDRSELPDELQYFLSGFPRLPADGVIESENLRTTIAQFVTQ